MNIKEYKNYYDYYTKLPKIILWINLIVGFLAIIVMSATTCDIDENRAVIIFLIGSIALGIESLITYVITKICISHNIMKVELLKKIAIKMDAISEKDLIPDNFLAVNSNNNN